MSAPTKPDAIQSVLAAERFLDGPVGEYRPKIIGTGLELGTASTLRDYYKQNLLNTPGRIVVGNCEIQTAPEVTAILRALLYTGCCRIEARSAACREVFVRACKAGPYIGVDELLATFEEKPINPFVLTLQNTIQELAGAR